jgi:hypothetical protein
MTRDGDDEEPGLSEQERQAIAKIRRELDAEFGPLEEPFVSSEPRPAEPRPDAARRDVPRRDVLRRPVPPRDVPPLARERVARPAPRRADVSWRRGVVLFLLGALVGGVAGGIAGAMTTVMWLRQAEEPAGRTAGNPDGEPVTAPPAAAVREPARDGVALESALNEWLAATKRGDIPSQMQFYPARVPVYYTWRNVTRDAVRDEKNKVFGAATRLQISTDEPTVEVADGGRIAVARFRKRYVIEGPVIRRRGEVLQELRWERGSDGWRIVSERDAEVLAP